MESVGMMDEGYFVSRNEILSWINNLLQLNLTKIEQLGTGAVYCQLLDILYPGKVPISKVNWKAKLEYEFIQNFKVLQACFINFKIERMIEIERLVKAKYQDNLEFAQWFKRFFELRAATRKDETYDAVNRRSGALVDFSFADKTVIPKTRNPQISLKKPLVEKKKELKENYSNVGIENGKPAMAKNLCVEEKNRGEEERNVLWKIENILKDDQKEEMTKLSEIYEIFGMKITKEPFQISSQIHQSSSEMQIEP